MLKLSPTAHTDNPDKAQAIQIANDMDAAIQSADHNWKAQLAKKAVEMFDAGSSVPEVLNMLADFADEITEGAASVTPEDEAVMKSTGISLHRWIQQNPPSKKASAGAKLGGGAPNNTSALKALSQSCLSSLKLETV